MIYNDNVAWDSLEYTVISITKISPPNINIVTDETWFKYIVGRSNNSVKCMRQGTLEEVTEHAKNLVDDLNSRRNITSGVKWRSKKPPLNTTTQ